MQAHREENETHGLGRIVRRARDSEIFTIRSQAQLSAALEKRKTMRHLRLGDALVQEGFITEKQRNHALAAQRQECHKQLGRILVEWHVLEPEALKRVLAQQLGVPVVDLARFAIEVDALAGLSAEAAIEHRAIPLRRNSLRMAVAVEDPTDWVKLCDIEQCAGVKIDAVLATSEAIDAALRRFYPAQIAISTGGPAQSSEKQP